MKLDRPLDRGMTVRPTKSDTGTAKIEASKMEG